MATPIDNLPPEVLFSTTFPLPYRVLSLVGLGILGWATNLHGLCLAGIDAGAALELDHYDSHLGRRAISPLPVNGPLRAGWKHLRGVPAIYSSLYRLFFVYAGWILANWLLYRYASSGDLYRVDTFKFIPAVAGLVVLMVIITPFNVFAKMERDRFLHAIPRCLFTHNNRIYFADVVFADVFTSIAKVLGDMWLSFCMLMPGGSLLVQPAQEGWPGWILPTLMSLPYAVRFRQCLIEYEGSTRQSRRPLYNALKYATSFPVIYLSAAQREVSNSSVKSNEVVAPGAWYGDRTLFRLWLFAAAVNSLYSFWWDVTHDWGFDLLVPRSASYSRLGRHTSPSIASPPRPLVLPSLHSRASSTSDQTASLLGRDIEVNRKTNVPMSTAQRSWHPFGLRPILRFPLAVYPFAITADLVLRLMWSVKLSSHLHSYADGDMLIFCFELAEVVRRWMWVFIRIEWETVKESRGMHSPRSARIADALDDEYEMVPSRT